MISLKNQKGITLIALVITVIIMLILAGITLNMLTGENSILKTGQKAAYKHGEEKGMEQIQLVLGEDSVERIQKGEKLTVNRLVDVFREPDKTWVRNVEGQNTNQDGTSGILTIINVEGYVYEIDVQGGHIEKIECIGTTTGPSIQTIEVVEKTTNSVSIKVNTSNAEDATYIYSYKKDGATDFIKVKESKENTYKYEGLDKETIYVLKVELKTKTGETDKTINVLTAEMPTGTIFFTQPVWNNGTASVEVSTITQHEIHIQKGKTNDNKTIEEIKNGTWEKAPADGVITGLVHNDKIYARIYDGTNYGTDWATVEIKDIEGPEVSVNAGSITSNSAILTVIANDEKAGLAEIDTYQYYLGTELKETSTTNSYKYEGLAFENNPHTLKVIVTDKVGNTNEASTTVNVEEVTSGLVEGAIKFTNQNWENGAGSIQISTTTSYRIFYQKNSATGKWTEIENNGTIGSLTDGDIIYARLYDGINYGQYTSTDIQDEIGPEVSVNAGSITSNSAVLTVTASDGQMGLAATDTYKYYLGTELKETSTTNSYKYEGLAFENNPHTLKVIVTDKVGNTNEASTTVNVTAVPSGLETGIITFGDEKWTNGTASVTVTTSKEGYILQYQKNTVLDNGWIPITSGNSVPELNHGDTVYARLWDGTNGGEYASTTVEDTNVPTAEIKISGTPTAGTNDWYKSNVTVQITGTTDLTKGGPITKVTYTLSGATTLAETIITSGNTITISAEGTTTIKAYAYTSAKKSEETTLIIKKDTVAPVVNTIAAGTPTDSSVTLTVNSVTEETSQVSSYQYYLDGALIKTVTTNTYDYTELAGGTTYLIGVKAIDNAGHTSELKTVSITTEKGSITAEDIEKTDIGKTVTNYTMGGQTWEVFYADDSNIYLITRGKVNDPKYSKNNTTGGVSSGTYNSGSSLLSDSTRYPAAAKWFSYANSGYNCATNQMKGAVFMLDSTGVWNSTYKHETWADYAIGGPTKELLAASINQGKGTNYSGEYYNETGYSSGGFALGSGTVWMHGDSYWLACPQYSSSYMVYADHSFNDTSYEAYNLSYSWIGFRPVVCLNSTVKLEVNADGTTLSIIEE